MTFAPKTNPHALRLLTAAAVAVLAMCAAYSAEPKDPHAVTIDAILTGIAAVETGTHRVSTGTIRGTWSYGEAGEVSPFQIHPSVLRDLGVHGKSQRIHRDPVLAESYARLWLIRLHHRLGNWGDAVAAWNGGERGFQRRAARDYSDRVMAIAGELQ